MTPLFGRNTYDLQYAPALPEWEQTAAVSVDSEPLLAPPKLYEPLKTDPDFTRRLCFNDMPEVFVQGNLIIGIYDNRLLAFDKNSEELVWDFTIPAARSQPRMYTLDRVGDALALHIHGENRISCIDINTGKPSLPLLLPHKTFDPI